MQLPDKLYAQVEKLSEEGNVAFDAGRYAAAIERWNAALALLPAPAVDWEAWTWLQTSIGDAYYQLGNFGAARAALFDALNGPGALDNPFIHYRLGQASVRQGRDAEGREHLLKAYMLDGEDIFQAEPDGPRYLGLLRTAGLVD
jgi:tetratricopeptide (TPR) repeat protein